MSVILSGQFLSALWPLAGKGLTSWLPYSKNIMWFKVMSISLTDQDRPH